MLSVLIPTYNYVCKNLVIDLQKQAESLGIAYEILVADDASDLYYKEQNRCINKLKNCRYIELEHNIGRARIRNFLAAEAQYTYFLFMDCDGQVISSHFIKDYLNCIPKAKVVCGGIVQPAQMPSKTVSLRYRYEKHAEKRFTAERRRQNPYGEFRSFNFLISKEIFNAHPFDETMVDYGFEDTLLGRALKESNIPICHINNPLMNNDLETNDIFLRKTLISLQTLYKYQKVLEGYSGVLSLYHKLRKCKLPSFVAQCYNMCSPLIQRNLRGSHPSLTLFKFYKIGCFCEIACRKNINITN